ncbi:MAG: collagen-like protein [Bacteroidales bacterium]|nr:collagen-like protein [Bacteroidales bacterium]
MKKLIGFFSLILATVLIAKSQVPNGFNYQFVLRDGDGSVMSNTGVTVKLSLTDISQSTVYYVETHDTTTNSLGIVNLVIGQGTVESGSFSEVPWSSGDVHIKVEVLPEGQSSYVFMGIDKLLSVPYALYAADGNTMQWLGSLANPPADPVKNQAYYSTLDKASYIWDGDSWELLAMDGLQGEQGPQGLQGDAGPQGEMGDPGTDGFSIDWLGELSSAPASPPINQAYYNTTESKSYIWNGNSWNLVAVDGEPGAVGPQGDIGSQGPAGTDGISIIWLGNLDSEPVDPTLNNAYYNTVDKIAYIWNGVDWQILAKDGAIGVQGPQGDVGLQGPAGSNGISIEWLGNLSNAPGTPSINQAYYNSTNKISYIWDGDSWEILAQDGQTGATGPQGPEGPEGPAGTGLTNKGNWVSGTTYDPGDYVFALNSGGTANSMWIVEASLSFTSTVEPRDDSSNWIEFEAPEGPAGTNGISVEWLGTYTVAPSSPSTNQAYYNSVDGKAYIWDGDSWEVLAQDGVQGPEGPLVSGTTGQTLRHNGTSWIASSLLYNNGVNIGINTTSPSQLMDINGNVRVRGLLYDYNNVSGTTGQFLTRGASGVLWQTPSWTTGTGSSGQMAIWNGSSTLTNLPNLTFSNSLVVVGNPTADPDDPIFEVKNNAGQVILGVYQEGVRINIAEVSSTKGAKRGFAVGGLTNATKGDEVEYLTITPDSTRIYVKDDVTKGAKRGFAVGGLTNATKGGINSFMQFTRENYLIGYDAGKAITTGLYNSILGYQAGMVNSVGSWNTFLGYQAGMNNTGSDNTFIGYQAGMVHQSKGGNVYIGSKAGANAQNGERNVLIGESSGYGITTGAKNVYIGFESGYSSTSGNYNVFLGTTTGRSNTTGSSNVFVGIGSGYNNVSGSNNLFLGTSSGLSNTTGSYNTFLGYETGYSNNSSYNSFVGYQSGRYNTDGQYNTFLGYRSGYTNSSGAKNIFIGYLAGYANTTASNNVFIGNLSGRYNTTGTNNMFFGKSGWSGKYNWI